MTFEQTITWLASYLAGAVASILQEYFKSSWLGRLNQKAVAVVLVALVSAATYLLMFVAGWPVFGDIQTPWDILAIVGAFLMGLGGSQTLHGFRRAK